MALEEKIELIGNSSITIALHGRYADTITLSGWVLQKPKFIQGNKKESCSFILHQINNIDGITYDKTFSILAYQPDVIELMRTVDKVSLVHVVGMLGFNSVKKFYFPQVFDAKISHVLDVELEPPYERKEKEK